jgi:hypothetical protein
MSLTTTLDGLAKRFDTICGTTRRRSPHNARRRQ